MMALGISREVSADVLVIGGGMAGLWAAIRASDFSKKVFLVDKGYISRSGCAPFAAGIYLLPFPDVDKNLWMEEIVKNGGFYNDQDWLSLVMDETYPLSMRLDEWGKGYGYQIYEKDVEGQILRRKSRANLHTEHVVINALPMMDTLRRKAKEKEVQFFERTMVTDLVVDEGRVMGAVGFNYRTHEIFYFKAPAVILSAGGTAFKAAFFGHKNLTGDLQAAAIRIGAIFQNMENILSNTSAKEYDICGLSLYVGCGGRFINGKGEEFMWAYHPDLGNRAPLQYVVMAMCREVKEGRGPIYLDMRRVREGDRELLRKILPESFRLWDRSKYHFFEDPIPWAPALPGTISAGGGMRIDPEGRSNIEGLYGAGDVTNVPPHGAYSVGGMNLSFAALSGYRSGEASASFVTSRKRTPGTKGLGRVKDLVTSLSQPLITEHGPEADEIISSVQKLMTSIEVSYIKSKPSLKAALAEIGRIREMGIPKATDGHSLVKALESQNLVEIAEMMIQASLLREESRGFHFREDFPKTDNINWLKWALVQKVNDGYRLWTIPIPTPYVEPEEALSDPPGVPFQSFPRK